MPAQYALVSTLARQLTRGLDDWATPDRPRLGGALLDLVTATLAARLNREEQLTPETRQRALLIRIQTYIEQQLADPGLSPDTIAAAHYISPRYLYRLFETQQTTVAAWIRQRRLEHCRRELLQPASADKPVSAIAARWGFSNAAHFSRVLRTQYGIAPTQYRRAATGSG
jgi:AraC-like DNA-binding protein